MAIYLTRKIKFLYYKLLRTKCTPHNLAMSIAVGIFTAFVIPDFVICGQTAASFFLAIRLRVNPGISYAVTWISNPITDIVLYPVFCYLGSYLIGVNLNIERIKEIITILVNNPSWSYFCSAGFDFAVSFIIGGIIIGTLSAIISYFSVYVFCRKFKKNDEYLQKKSIAL